MIRTNVSRRVALLLLTACIAAFPLGATGAAIEQGFNQQTVPRNDDSSLGPVAIGFEIDLFGLRRNTLYVNNNGNVTFDEPLFTFTPFNLLTTQALIVAPFFADVDTSVAGSAVTYGTGSFQGRRAFGVNWVDVDYFPSTPNHTNRNSFQLLLVDRADRGSGDFDIVFNYDRIQWESGQASGGDVNGRGGASARAGYAIGRGAPGSSLELQGSAVNGAFLDNSATSLIRGSRGSTIPGRYVFEIRASNRAAQISTITPFADAPSFSAASDASGRFVIYQSQAGNLVSGGLRGRNDIYLTDTVLGTTRRLSLAPGGSAFARASEPSISGDGAFALFVAPAATTNGKAEGDATWLRNLLTGTSQQVGGASVTGTTTPRFSASGNAFVITRPVTNASEGAMGQNNVYLVRLTRNGDAVTAGPELCISCKAINANGSNSTTNSDGASSNGALNADGTIVAWETTANNALIGNAPVCAGASSDIMLRNLVTGVTQRLSQPSSGSTCGSGGSRAPTIDFAGDTIAFESDLPLQGSDQNTVSDIYLFDTGTGARTHVSTPASGQANGASTQAAISGDGDMVAFTSAATNLDTGLADTNAKLDVHVRRASGGTTTRLSLTEAGAQANGDSVKPSLTADGSRISFESNAGNLAIGAVLGQSAVFQRANPLAAPSSELKTATWWNPNESGWGVFTLDQGNVLAAGWFTFDTDGEPVWFLLPNATAQADGSFASPILRYTGTPLAQITGAANDAPSAIGTGKLRFLGRDLMNFEFVIGGVAQTKQLVRFAFGDRDLACMPSPQASRAGATNYSDLWYSPTSPGWGVHMSHVDNSLFATWYTYDTDREATYMLAPTTRQSGNTFTGTVFDFPNGTPYPQINGTIASGGAASSVGTATLSFSNGENATFSYTVNGVSQSKALQRLVVGSVPGICQPLAFDTQRKAASDVELHHPAPEARQAKTSRRP